MNKQFEFRSWDGKKFSFSCDCLGEGVELWALSEFFEWATNDKVQQFTGALDKNNRQIFEGDIVLYENPDPYDNETLLVKIVGYNSRVMGFRLYNFSHEVNKSGGTSFFPEEVEVIGNIFEGASKDGVDYGKWLVEK